MTSLDRCFFCCKFIPQDKNQLDQTDSFDEPFSPIELNTNTGEISDGNTLRECVLRISHYLKVPKMLIDQEDQELGTVMKACLDCTHISKTLSGLCATLEITKMMIDHHLKFLSNRITDYSTDVIHSNLTSFQKTVHQKCTSKVQKNEKTPHPQIRLTKCTKLISPSSPEVTTAAIKVEDNPRTIAVSSTDIELPHSCPFCDYLLNGPYELLHSHIQTQHPEQLKNEEPEMISTSQTLKSPVPPIKKPVKPKLTAFKCTKCGTKFTCKGSLNRHLRENSACADDETNRLNFKDRFECSSCNRRFSRRAALMRHIRKTCKLGAIIDHCYPSDKMFRRKDKQCEYFLVPCETSVVKYEDMECVGNGSEDVKLMENDPLQI